MTPPGHLHLLRGPVTLFLFLFLGLLLLALPPGTQGLPSIGRSPDSHPYKYSFNPIAHLVGDSHFSNSLRWTANTDHTFLHRFSLINNSLVVPTSGLYFVYSQVLFTGDSCPSNDIPVYLTHEVQLFSSLYPTHRPILSAETSLCPGIEGSWMRSLYVGAVFLLTQGDQLSTQTDGIVYLDFRPSSVFFGAFAL